jgi:chromosome segregation ATPase
MKEHSQNDDDNPNMRKNKHKTNNDKLNEDTISLEEIERELAEKDELIVQLKSKLVDFQERIHEVIIEKGSLEKQVKEFELKGISLQLDNFEDLKNNYNKLEHRLIITKNQLDDARIQIKSQNEFVENAREQVEFMETVIVDLENRGLIDFLRNRFPESFVTYKKK